MIQQRYRDMELLTLYIRSFIKYQMFLYQLFLEQQLNQYKFAFVALCSVFALSSVLLGVFLWRPLIKELFNQVNTIKGIVLLITFSRIDSTAKMKRELVDCRVSDAFSWFRMKLLVISSNYCNYWILHRLANSDIVLLLWLCDAFLDFPTNCSDFDAKAKIVVSQLRLILLYGIFLILSPIAHLLLMSMVISHFIHMAYVLANY